MADYKTAPIQSVHFEWWFMIAFYVGGYASYNYV